MNDILRAIGTFLIALVIGVGVEKSLVAFNVETHNATAIGTVVLLAVGFWICNLRRKKPSQN